MSADCTDLILLAHSSLASCHLALIVNFRSFSISVNSHVEADFLNLVANVSTVLPDCSTTTEMGELQLYNVGLLLNSA